MAWLFSISTIRPSKTRTYRQPSFIEIGWLLSSIEPVLRGRLLCRVGESMGEWWDKIRKRFNDWNQEREEEIKRAWDVLDRRGIGGIRRGRK